MTVDAPSVGEQTPRLFSIVFDVADDDEPERLVTAGHGLEFPDGSAVFVWARQPDGRRAYGEFTNIERALYVVGMTFPADLIWCDASS